MQSEVFSFRLSAEEAEILDKLSRQAERKRGDYLKLLLRQEARKQANKKTVRNVHTLAGKTLRTE